MFLQSGNYDEVCAFIYGLNYAYEGEPLDQFDNWLREKFSNQSPFTWKVIIQHEFEKKMQHSKSKVSEIDFLFLLLNEYFNEQVRNN